jgi:hypothetical protein
MVDNFHASNMLFVNFQHLFLGLSGFYEVIYKGKDFSLLAKWKKSETIGLSSKEIDLFSKPERSLFFLNDKKSCQVKNKKEFAFFLGLTKRELKSQLKFRFSKLSTASNAELCKLTSTFDSRQ